MSLPADDCGTIATSYGLQAPVPPQPPAKLDAATAMSDYGFGSMGLSISLLRAMPNNAMCYQDAFARLSRALAR